MSKLNSKEEMKIFFEIADKLYYGEQRNIRNIFELSHEYWSKKEAFIYEDENHKTHIINYDELYKICYRFADSFTKSFEDIKKGEYVALKLRNSPTWVYSFYGLLIAGYKVLLINPILNNSETTRLLDEVSAQGIVSENDEDYGLININSNKIVLGEYDLAGQYEWEDEVAFSTSGTTGDSRIFVYTGANLVEQIYAAYVMPDTTIDIMYTEKFGKLRQLAIIPFSHIFGFVAVFLWYTFFGMCIVFPDSISSLDIVKFAKKYKVSHIFGVPLVWESVAKSFNLELGKMSEKKQLLVRKMMDYNNDLISASEAGIATRKFFQNIVKNKILGAEIRYCIAGGSAIAKDTLLTINGLGYPLYNGYGMTEIGITSVELSRDVNRRNLGSVGKPLTNVSYKIINGEICVKSKQIHSYRFVNKAKLPALVDKDGYFHTGDTGYIDGNGYLYIKGKIKDIIILSNGENVYPEEVEKYFKDISYTSNIAVVEFNKQISLILEVNAKINNEQLKIIESEVNKANEKLPNEMAIKQIYLSLESFPINASLKLKRHELLENMKSRPNNYLKLDRNDSLNLQEDVDLEKFNKIRDNVIELMSNFVEVRKEDITPTSHFILDLGGDSFTYMSLIGELEEKYDIGFPSEVLGHINTPNEISLYLYKNIKD